jgi:hypothetical protein
LSDLALIWASRGQLSHTRPVLSLLNPLITIACLASTIKSTKINAHMPLPLPAAAAAAPDPVTHLQPAAPAPGDALVTAALKVLRQPDGQLKAAWTLAAARLWRSGAISRRARVRMSTAARCCRAAAWRCARCTTHGTRR